MIFFSNKLAFAETDNHHIWENYINSLFTIDIKKDAGPINIEHISEVLKI